MIKDMDITKEMRLLIDEHVRILEDNGGTWSEELGKCYLKEVEVLMRDIDESIRFLDEYCTAEECGCLSELLLELTKRTGDDRFLNCFINLRCKYRDEIEYAYISDTVYIAEVYLSRIRKGTLGEGINQLEVGIRELAQKQKRITDENTGLWSEELNECYLKEVEVLMRDVDESIRCIREECTGKECGYLSELLLELTKRTGDDRFLNCFRELDKKYRKDPDNYYLTEGIEAAALYLEVQG